MKTTRDFLVILVVCLLPAVATAATVTVNGSQPTAGANFQTLREALEAYNSAAWRDGSGDTILVTDDTVNIFQEQLTTYLGDGNAQGDLTVMNNPGDTPVIKLTATTPGSMFWQRGMTLTIDGLTFIGPIGADSPYNVVNMYTWGTTTVKNCIFTANNGADAPILDWSQPAPSSGRIRVAIIMGDGALEAEPSSMTIQNCTFAYNSEGDGVVIGNRGMTNPDHVGSFTMDNCLFAKTLRGLRWRAGGGLVNGPIPLVMRNCLFYDLSSRGVSITNPVDAPIDIEDCIFAYGGGPAIGYVGDPGGISATVTLRRCTLISSDTGEPPLESGPININDLEDGEGHYVLEDVILAEGGVATKGAFRLTQGHDAPYTVGAVPLSVTLAGVAVVAPALPYSPEQSTIVKNAFNGLRSGAGPLTADPEFARTAITAADAAAGWDASTNNLFDVTAEAYATASSSGSLLYGGARQTPTVVNPAYYWTTFE